MCIRDRYQRRVHGEIRKVLLDEEGNSKIIGAGWSDLMRLGILVRSLERGQYDRLPPESLRQEFPGKETDVWALGILLYELIHGFPPFRGTDPEMTKALIQRGEIPHWDEKISKGARDLIQRLTRSNPEERLTIDQIFKHPWMRVHEQSFNLRFEDYMSYVTWEQMIEDPNSNRDSTLATIDKDSSRSSRTSASHTRSTMPVIDEVENEEEAIERENRAAEGKNVNEREMTIVARKVEDNSGFFDKLLEALGCIRRQVLSYRTNYSIQAVE
eukprot:TRINITY_DN6974_c0_g3_i2.p1 TRINITY_DN6974_c0_g3~~TRINITY_DN6974_c0_g3_i2.p1  ORF type:complete len:287 (-),score=46.17 TRINITY_DN6974_c0_g3_i2:155-967(-)